MYCFPNQLKDDTLSIFSLSRGSAGSPACIAAQPPHPCALESLELPLPWPQFLLGTCTSDLILPVPKHFHNSPVPSGPHPRPERPSSVLPASLIPSLPQLPPGSLPCSSWRTPCSSIPHALVSVISSPGKFLCLLQGSSPPSQEPSLFLPSLEDFKDFLPIPTPKLCCMPLLITQGSNDLVLCPSSHSPTSNPQSILRTQHWPGTQQA